MNSKLLTAAAVVVVSGGVLSVAFLPGMLTKNKDGQASISQAVQGVETEQAVQQPVQTEQTDKPEAMAPEPAKADKPAQTVAERKEYYAFDPRGEYIYKMYGDDVKIVITDSKYEIWELVIPGSETGEFKLQETKKWILKIDGIYTKGSDDSDYSLSVIIRNDGKMFANIGYDGAVAELTKIK